MSVDNLDHSYNNDVKVDNDIPMDPYSVQRIKEPILLQIGGILINLLIHVLTGITIFMCGWYASLAEPMSAYKIHVILCVLGYHFFMVQGILLLSKYSNWATLLSFRKKINFHWGLQICGLILTTTGSVYIMKSKLKNFNTAHGVLGLLALLTSLITLATGILYRFVGRFTAYLNRRMTKLSHFFTGGLTLVFSSICLSLEYKSFGFQLWSSDSIASALVVISTLTSVLVLLDRLFVVLRNKITSL